MGGAGGFVCEGAQLTRRGWVGKEPCATVATGRQGLGRLEKTATLGIHFDEKLRMR
jgi:hypothetical protein